MVQPNSLAVRELSNLKLEKSFQYKTSQISGCPPGWLIGPTIVYDARNELNNKEISEILRNQSTVFSS